MSISPLNSGASQSSSSASLLSSLEKPLGNESLSLSQALIITAGMAGLIGLFSGMIIRFSLANSSHARFLSPLQTFPTLSNWTPAQPQGVFPETSSNQRQEIVPTPILAAGESESAGLLRQGRREEPDETLFDVTSATGSNFVAPTTFDAFADRNASVRRMTDPLEALKAGPKLSEAPNSADVETNDFTDGFYPEIEGGIAGDGAYYEYGD